MSCGAIRGAPTCEAHGPGSIPGTCHTIFGCNVAPLMLLRSTRHTFTSHTPRMSRNVDAVRLLTSYWWATCSVRLTRDHFMCHSGIQNQLKTRLICNFLCIFITSNVHVVTLHSGNSKAVRRTRCVLHLLRVTASSNVEADAVNSSEGLQIRWRDVLLRTHFFFFFFFFFF